MKVLLIAIVLYLCGVASGWQVWREKPTKGIVETGTPTETTFVKIDTNLSFEQVYSRPTDENFDGTLAPQQSVRIEACFQLVMSYDSVFEIRQILGEYKKPVLRE